MSNATTSATSTAPTWGERILGAFAYFCWVLPPFYLLPLLIFRWKRNTSRFVALHAAQSALLAIAVHVLYFAVAVVWFSVTGLVKSKAQGDILSTTMIILLFGPITWGYLGMPFVPLRGRPAALPVLGRRAERILDAPPGGGGMPAGASAGPAYTAQRPEDRLLAGAAYFCLLSPGLFLLGPLAVYLWKRKASRFVEYHALQALLLHILLVPAALALFMGGFAATAVLVRYGAGPRGFGGELVFVGYMAAIASPVVILWRGFAAALGPPDAMPLLGRMARWRAKRRGRP